MLFVKVSKKDKTCNETQKLILYDKKLGKPAKGNCRTTTFSDHTMLLINFQIRHLAYAKKRARVGHHPQKCDSSGPYNGCNAKGQSQE